MNIVNASVIENSTAVFLAHVAGIAGTNITQAALESITCKVFDLSLPKGSEPVATPTVTKTESVFDTLQRDSRWTVNATGYNFAHEMPSATFSDGQRRYRIEYKCTQVGGKAFYLLFEVDSVEIYSE